MRALKGLLIYIGIILGVIVGAGAILICIMYFFPQVRIAGIGMVHYNKTQDEQVIELAQYDYSDPNINLTISSKSIGVNVVPSEDDNIKYSLKLSVFGMSSEIVEYQAVRTVEVDENGSLNVFLTITEPKGWISTQNSLLKIYVPKDMVWDISATTQSGLVVLGSSSHALIMDNLAVSTESGDLSLVNVGSIGTERSLELSSLALTTKNGKFDLSKIDNLTVINSVKLKAQDGEFIFKNLYASVDITGSGIKLIADKILCGNKGFSFIGNNGYITVGTLESPDGSENTIITENISASINTISGKTGVVTTYGNLTIGTTNSYTTIDNLNGNVNIDKAMSNITITANMGNIAVNAYYASGKFINNRGDINVYSRADYIEGCVTEILNVDGNIKVKNEINRLILTTTGRSKAEVVFGKIKDNLTNRFSHKIDCSTNGSCIVYFPTVNISAFEYTAGGIIDGDLESGTGVQYFPNSSADNIQTAQSTAKFTFTGKITIKGHPWSDISTL